MASPSYGIDVVALAFAVILAAVLALLLSHLVPQLVGLIRQGAPNAARREAADAFAAGGVRDSLKRFLTVAQDGPWRGLDCGAGRGTSQPELERAQVMAELSALATLESASPAGGTSGALARQSGAGGSAREPSLPTQQQFHLFVPYIRKPIRLSASATYISGMLFERMRRRLAADTKFIEPCLPSPADKPPPGANWITRSSTTVSG